MKICPIMSRPVKCHDKNGGFFGSYTSKLHEVWCKRGDCALWIKDEKIEDIVVGRRWEHYDNKMVDVMKKEIIDRGHCGFVKTEKTKWECHLRSKNAV